MTHNQRPMRSREEIDKTARNAPLDGNENRAAALLAVEAIASGEELHDDKSPSEKDSLFDEAVAAVREEDHASRSLLQRKLEIGYVQSSRLMDQLEAAGIISPKEGGKPRKVL